MKNLLLLCVLLLVSCKSDKDQYWSAVFNNSSQQFQNILEEKDKYELQILFAKIDSNQQGLFQNTKGFNVNSDHYFYPASAVKMPVAFLALEKINELQESGIAINKFTTLRIDSNRMAQSPVISDSTSINQNAFIAHYINKLFAVSDNDAYNRLFEFLGRDYINEKLKQKKSFTNSRIVTRVGVSGFDYKENGYTNSFSFIEGDSIIYRQEEQISNQEFLLPLENCIKGKGYYDDSADSVIMKPFDMSKKNFINLSDMQTSMIRLFYPKLFDEEERFKLSNEDLKFLKTAMSKLPKEYDYPTYDSLEYYDSYVKFFMFGDSKDPIPEHIKIYNKVGYAYGTLTDCAYIVDKQNGLEFFLAATLLVNENQIFNDGAYEYDSIGIPFLAELGRLIYQYELENK